MIGVLAVDLRPELDRGDPTITIAVARNEAEDGHAGQHDQSRIRRERLADRRRMGVMSRDRPARPGCAEIATGRHADPAIADRRDVHRPVVVVGAEHAGGIARPDAAGRLVLLLEPDVTDIPRVLHHSRADNIYVRPRISRKYKALGERRLRGNRAGEQ